MLYYLLVLLMSVLLGGTGSNERDFLKALEEIRDAVITMREEESITANKKGTSICVIEEIKADTKAAETTAHETGVKISQETAPATTVETERKAQEAQIKDSETKTEEKKAEISKQEATTQEPALESKEPMAQPAETLPEAVKETEVKEQHSLAVETEAAKETQPAPETRAETEPATAEEGKMVEEVATSSTEDITSEAAKELVTTTTAQKETEKEKATEKAKETTAVKETEKEESKDDKEAVAASTQTQNKDEIPLKKVWLDSTNVTVKMGTVYNPIYYYSPAKATVEKVVTWKSSNPEVATVSTGGTVKTLKPGTAVISGTLGEMTASVTITVEYAEIPNVQTDECYEILNHMRKEHGLPALKRDAKLEELATIRAKELTTLFGHKRPNGGRGTGIIEGNLYKGENLAAGQKTCERVMQAWFDSQGHRDVMLGEHYTKVGIMAIEFNGVIYWVMLASS